MNRRNEKIIQEEESTKIKYSPDPHKIWNVNTNRQQQSEKCWWQSKHKKMGKT